MGAAARWGRRRVSRALRGGGFKALLGIDEAFESARVDAKCSNKFNTHLSVQKHNSHRFREIRVLLWGPFGLLSGDLGPALIIQ